ncbi:hypothetical protein EUGRSUZ_J00235 [Eucalyptus grandis]|uniref:Uncharacterized protein n=2 Tax=Eucalyptus grandis TaxID=71139 RepID=A0ACC3J187_EUCGR|nr:hypothetical protein EUGRSUZ_J00235 [Eucalyptus grandis]
MKLLHQKCRIGNCSLLTFTTDIQEIYSPHLSCPYYPGHNHFLFKSEIMKNRLNDWAFPLFCYLLLTIFSNST